jgi:glycosyltransferase involved in cell wall biosynthesis
MKQSAPAASSRMPVVSVVTPAYNAARYLPETVGSLLRQNFSDFELVIVDDGSRDDTLAVAHRFAAIDGRVRVVSTPNGGPAAARNRALREARGEFIALLDSDDTIAPEYLARQLAVLDANPDAAIVTANAFNRGGGSTYDGKPFWPQTTGLQRITVRDLIEHEDSVCILSVFRRRVVEVIGGFSATFTGNEDYEFWLRAALAGFVIVRNFQPLGVYRRLGGSLSSDEPRMIRGVMRVLQHVDGALGNWPAEREVLRRQMERFERELPRAELRATLQRNDAAAAARALRALAADRGGWLLSTVARITQYWPQPLLWAYRLRRSVRVA